MKTVVLHEISAFSDAYHGVVLPAGHLQLQSSWPTLDQPYRHYAMIRNPHRVGHVMTEQHSQAETQSMAFASCTFMQPKRNGDVVASRVHSAFSKQTRISLPFVQDDRKAVGNAVPFGPKRLPCLRPTPTAAVPSLPPCEHLIDFLHAHIKNYEVSAALKWTKAAGEGFKAEFILDASGMLLHLLLITFN